MNGCCFGVTLEVLLALVWLEKYLKSLFCNSNAKTLSAPYIEDKAFVKDHLHYTYRCDHASEDGSLVVNRRALTPANFTFYIKPNANCIHTENPECIFPADSAQVVARYGDTTLSAGVAYDGETEGKGKTLSWAFMLESVQDFATLYKDCIQWLMQ